MKKLILLVLGVVLLAPISARADEGMWLLPFLKDKNIGDMKRAGFKLSAEDVYSVNKHALKDAIVIFGGGCTGEVISSKGLLLTNHHCGYGTIQKHSTVENDYLKYGFWAQSFEEEIPSPGLGVIFIRKITDVTNRALEGITATMPEVERDSILKLTTKAIREEFEKNSPYEIEVKAMFGGNQFFVFERERFGDVRMVGVPPSSIGKYGGDTDNWMWPRHTGDFAMFRIYADKDNKATKDYSADNVPYNAPKHLTISSKGIKDGDYAMIMGFPGSTKRYMTTWEIDQVLEQDNPIRIHIRGEKQKVWWEDMLASPKVKIQYANKFAGSSNYWKNSIGMSRGLRRLNVRAEKQAEQDAFMKWVNADPVRVEKYGDALELIEQAVQERRSPMRSAQIINEVLGGAEAYTAARVVSQNILNSKDKDKTAESLIRFAENFAKDYNAPTDKKSTLKMFEIMADSLPAEDMPAFLNFSFAKSYGENFDNSPYSNPAVLLEMLKDTSHWEALLNDPLAVQVNQIMPIGRRLTAAMTPASKKFAEGHRKYLAGLLEMTGGKKMYPDANFTMRFTYGNVKSYDAADAVHYDYYTTLTGAIEKADASNPDFQLDPKLYELWATKDYGRWGERGEMITCFVSTNDITGGNSGSGVLNGRGELIGLAFDGNWEAMSGDIAFEPNVQRTISVDIRYVMFIVEKYAGATRLIKEMTIR